MTLFVAVQPYWSVPVTVYCSAWSATMDCVTSPELHTYELAPVAVIVVLLP